MSLSIEAKIRQYLIADVCELSDPDFLYFDSLFDFGQPINKYAYPSLIYSVDQDARHIYLVGLNNVKYFIGHYLWNQHELNICVPFAFMSRRTINNITSFNVTQGKEDLVLKNLLYLDKVSYYFKGYELLSTPAFKFADTGNLRFGSYWIKYKNSFSVLKTDNTLRFDFNYDLYYKNGSSDYYIGPIHVQKFKTGLAECLDTQTLTLFNKKFNKLTKKELLVLQMNNIS